MKVRYTAVALAEIREVYSYIAARNSAAANEILVQLDHTIALISEHPKIGPVKYRDFVRMLPLRRYPKYLLFYSIEDHQIVILNLRHAARRPLWSDDER
jgi:plasmid stabilization system protein ParE